MQSTKLNFKINFKKYILSFIALLTSNFLSNLAWADYTLNMTPGVSKISHKIYHLHMTIFWICVAIGIIVFSILIYSLIMHRKSIGHKPADFHENTAVEIIWTIIPFVILISMAICNYNKQKFHLI
jgi:cytochrome c oxidase subunit 2